MAPLEVDSESSIILYAKVQWVHHLFTCRLSSPTRLLNVAEFKVQEIYIFQLSTENFWGSFSSAFDRKIRSSLACGHVLHAWN